jgi:hypothetical protein
MPRRLSASAAERVERCAVAAMAPRTASARAVVALLGVGDALVVAKLLAVGLGGRERGFGADELGDDELRPVLLAGGQRLFQLGPIVALAALDLGKFIEQRPLAAVEIVDHGLALGIEAEAGLALLIGRHPVIGDELAEMCGQCFGSSPAYLAT